MLTRLRRVLAGLVRRDLPPADGQVYDIWTRTEGELRLEEIDARKRRYLRTALPGIGLVLFALFVPLPVPLRVGVLVLGVLLAPFAVAATMPRRHY